MSCNAHLSDDELMAAFVVGDAAAMETLFLRYRRGVYSWLLRMTNDASEAEDVYQDVWGRIIRRAGDYRPGNFKAWLWRIVRNAATDRSRKMSPLLVLDAPVDVGDECGQTVLEQLCDESAADALRRIEAQERKSMVRNAIDALPPAQKEIVLLRINGELSFKEIAESLTLPMGTVLARMHHAVKGLKESLLKKGVLQ